MIFKNSRYRELCDNSLNARLTERKVQLEAGVLEHVVKQDERLDQLAYYYYENASLWWKILDANPDILSAADFALGNYVGETIVIPGFNARQAG